MFRAIFSARREENGCGSRIGREKAHFLGVKSSGGRVRKTINDRFSERFARCRRSNAIRKGERRRGSSVKGKRRICLAHFPSPLRSPLRCPSRRARSAFSSFPTYRFAFDTQTLYAHVARVENGGRQFLFLRSKKHPSPLIAIFQRRRGSIACL